MDQSNGNRRVLSPEFIESVVAKNKNLTITDSHNLHLKLVVRQSGKKSFYYRARIQGVEKKLLLGSTEELSLATARVICKSYDKSFSESGANHSEILKDAVQKSITVDDVFQLYQENELRHRSTLAGRRHGLELAYKRHVKTELGSIEVRELSRKRCRQFFTQLESLGYCTHNKVLTVLKSAFNYVIEYEEELAILSNPFQNLKKMPGVVRTRYLTIDEGKKFLAALDKVNNQNVADIYRLALFTGARISNVRQMKWSEISLSNAIWIIPGNSTKTKRTFEIPLHQIAINVLLRRRGEGICSDFVFHSAVSKYGYITGGDPVWREVLEKAGLYHSNPAIRPRPHDLRRTFATWQLQNGTDISVVSKSLCHTSLKHTMVYAHSNIEQLRSSLDGAFSKLL